MTRKRISFTALGLDAREADQVLRNEFHPDEYMLIKHIMLLMRAHPVLRGMEALMTATLTYSMNMLRTAPPDQVEAANALRDLLTETGQRLVQMASIDQAKLTEVMEAMSDDVEKH